MAGTSPEATTSWAVLSINSLPQGDNLSEVHELRPPFYSAATRRQPKSVSLLHRPLLLLSSYSLHSYWLSYRYRLLGLVSLGVFNFTRTRESVKLTFFLEPGSK